MGARIRLFPLCLHVNTWVSPLQTSKILDAKSDLTVSPSKEGWFLCGNGVFWYYCTLIIHTKQAECAESLFGQLFGGSLPHNNIYGRGICGRGTCPCAPLNLALIAPNVKLELCHSVMHRCVYSQSNSRTLEGWWNQEWFEGFEPPPRPLLSKAITLAQKEWEN